MNKLTIGVLAIVVILAIAGMWYFGQGNVQPSQNNNNQNIVNEEQSESNMQENSENMQADNTTSENMNGDTMAGDNMASDTAQSAVKEFTVEGQNYSFSPSTITVNKGDTVKITLKNVGGTHNLIIDEFEVGTPIIQTGQEATIQFVASKTGQFVYYCSVDSHRAKGMWGTLTVN